MKSIAELLSRESVIVLRPSGKAEALNALIDALARDAGDRHRGAGGDGKLQISVKSPETCAIFLSYKQKDGQEKPVRTGKDGDMFTAVIADRPPEYTITAQDGFLNSTGSRDYEYRY